MLNNEATTGTVIMAKKAGQYKHKNYRIVFSTDPPAQNVRARKIFPNSEPPRYVLNRIRILVAEDNPVNCIIVRSMLDKLGVQTILVHNGMDAVDVFKRVHFHLVLMDCQMPGMDGFQATASIRKFEHTHDKPRLPIIAMTANTSEEDRERCRTAGMDDYLHKPFDYKALEKIIKVRLFSHSTHALLSEPESQQSSYLTRDAIWDEPKALALVDGDAEFLAEIAMLFLERIPVLWSALSDAITRADSEAVVQAAHAIKSAAVNFSARTTVEIASNIEVMGRNESLLDINLASTRLKHNIAQLESELREWTKFR